MPSINDDELVEIDQAQSADLDIFNEALSRLHPYGRIETIDEAEERPSGTISAVYSTLQGGRTPRGVAMEQAEFMERQQRRDERSRRYQEMHSRGESQEDIRARQVSWSPRYSPTGDYIECGLCGNSIDRSDRTQFIGRTRRGNYICPACSPMFITCPDCSHVEREENSSEVDNGNVVCENCYDNGYSECENCSHLIRNSEIRENDSGDQLCGECYSELVEESDGYGDGIPYRNFSKKEHPEFINPKKGKIITSARKFSAEIECYYSDYEKAVETLRKIPKEFGVATDGSLGSEGIEIQTPILGGKAGEETIKNVGKELLKNKFYVDNTCGLHIHLDAVDLQNNPEILKRVWAFYIVFEDVILSFLPRSRRQNNYCRLLKNQFHVAEVVNTYDMENLEKLWYRSNHKGRIKGYKRDKYHDSRYSGINFHSLLAYGHIEIRYHSGTINPFKILEWANLHLQILDKSQKIETSILRNASHVIDLKEKKELFFNLLKLSPSSQSYLENRHNLFYDAKSTEEKLTDKEIPSCAE